MRLLVSDYAGQCEQCHRCMVRVNYPKPLPGFVVRIYRAKFPRCLECEHARQQAEAERRLHKVEVHAAATSSSYAGWQRRRNGRLARAERVRKLKEAGVLA